MMAKIVGLDISSITIGISILEPTRSSDFILDYKSMKECNNLSERIEILTRSFQEIFTDKTITHCVIEDCLKGFKGKFFRPDALVLLGAVNALSQYIITRDYPHVTLTSLNVRHARKLVFGQLLKSYKNTEFKTEKNYIFHKFMELYSTREFPLKPQKPRSKKIEIIDEAYDMVDAWVMSKALTYMLLS